MDISLQLWSIKEEAEKDFAGALALVEKAGYRGVEFAGYYGNTPERVKEMLAACGLKAVSSHVGIDRLQNNWDGEIQYLKTLGFKLIVCPWVSCASKEEVLQNAAILESCAQKAAQDGITVGYHNHAHEFVQFDGRYALDILLEKAPTVQFQPDVYWIAHAGVDPVRYLKPVAEAGRICAIHAKEIAKTGTANVYVGRGRIDFKAIAALCPPARYPYIVEQEEFSSDHFDGIRQSCEGLRKVLE
ncbi:MAG: sugar phosphate isomerase/epimerase [Treponema sp.]|jgi:sugar phosphate isomerase/epimerase|nr:sugar phosphate isomerase/epimerase [Treponema sp.]